MMSSEGTVGAGPYWVFLTPRVEGPLPRDLIPPGGPRSFATLAEAQTVEAPALFEPWIQGPSGYHYFRGGQWLFWPFRGGEG